MKHSSNQKLYTVPSSMNIGINIRTHYIGPNESILKDNNDNLQVLFFKNEHEVDNITSTLNRWTSLVDSCREESSKRYAKPFEDTILEKIKFGESNLNNEKNKIVEPLVESFSGKRVRIDRNIIEGKTDNFMDLEKFDKNLVSVPTEENRQLNIQYNNGDNNNKELNKGLNNGTKITIRKNRAANKQGQYPMYHPNFSEEKEGYNHNNDISLNFVNGQNIRDKLADDNKCLNNMQSQSCALRLTTKQINGMSQAKMLTLADNENSNLNRGEKKLNDENYGLSGINIDTKNNTNSFSKNSEIIKQSNKYKNCKNTLNSLELDSTGKVDPYWNLFRLYNLFKVFYVEGTYERNLIFELNTREQLILCKIIKVNINEIPKLVGNRELIASIADKYFGNGMKKKGYKVTNNKRFVFRKVRAILYKNLQNLQSSAKVSKKSRDAKFFIYYFQNAPEYSKLTTKERNDVKSLLKTYEESKIGVVWKFKAFTEDFSKVFFNFPEELTKAYYLKKVCALKFCLEYLDYKDDEQILKSDVPIKCLPRPLNVIKQYMADFFNSFGDYLTKE